MTSRLGNITIIESEDEEIDQLKQEFMEMACKPDLMAWRFALDNSENFCDESTRVLMRIMEKVPSGGGTSLETIIQIASVVLAGRERLVEAFGLVAHDWAVAEYAARIAEMEEMKAEMEETA